MSNESARVWNGRYIHLYVLASRVFKFMNVNFIRFNIMPFSIIPIKCKSKKICMYVCMHVYV